MRRRQKCVKKNKINIVYFDCDMLLAKNSIPYTHLTVTFANRAEPGSQRKR